MMMIHTVSVIGHRCSTRGSMHRPIFIAGSTIYALMRSHGRQNVEHPVKSDLFMDSFDPTCVIRHAQKYKRISLL